jgi:hypothetical protein
VETCPLRTISTVCTPTWWKGPRLFCRVKRRHLYPVPYSKSYSIPFMHPHLLTLTPGLPLSTIKMSSHCLSRGLLLILLLMGGVHPNPGPSNSQCSVFMFLQFNTNVIRSSSAKLASFLSDKEIKIACIQESKLFNKSKTRPFPGMLPLERIGRLAVAEVSSPLFILQSVTQILTLALLNL